VKKDHRTHFLPKDHFLVKEPMAISPDHIIRAYSDGFVAVRDRKGDLLGIIPSTLPTEDYIQTPLGQMEVWSALTVCVVPAPAQLERLAAWPGFIPATPKPTAPPPADQSDIGEPP
jgi:hypothetical protein